MSSSQANYDDNDDGQTDRQKEQNKFLRGSASRNAHFYLFDIY